MHRATLERFGTSPGSGRSDCANLPDIRPKAGIVLEIITAFAARRSIFLPAICQDVERAFLG